MFQWRAEIRFLCSLLVINVVVGGGEEGVALGHMETSVGEMEIGRERPGLEMMQEEGEGRGKTHPKLHSDNTDDSYFDL